MTPSLLLFNCGNYNFDILPEFRPDGWDDEDEDDWFDDEEQEPEEVSEKEVRWRVEIKYADDATQEIVSYHDYLFDIVTTVEKQQKGRHQRKRSQEGYGEE